MMKFEIIKVTFIFPYLTLSTDNGDYMILKIIYVPEHKHKTEIKVIHRDSNALDTTYLNSAVLNKLPHLQI
jgi:hypothetical protein